MQRIKKLLDHLIDDHGFTEFWKEIENEMKVEYETTEYVENGLRIKEYARKEFRGARKLKENLNSQIGIELSNCSEQPSERFKVNGNMKQISDRIEAKLKQHSVKLNTNYSKKASVLIPILEKHNELYVLLTKRSRHLRSHSGQMSFPGGKQDPTDRDAVETALRETEEEVGIEPKYVNIIGRLDQILSRKYQLVSPFVGILQPGYKVDVNTNLLQIKYLFFFCEFQISRFKKMTARWNMLCTFL